MGFQSVLAIYLMIIARVGAFLPKVRSPPGAPFCLYPLPCVSGIAGGFGFRCCFYVSVVFWGFFGVVLVLDSYCVATEWLECVENKRAQYRVMRNHYFVSHR